MFTILSDDLDAAFAIAKIDKALADECHRRRKKPVSGRQRRLAKSKTFLQSGIGFFKMPLCHKYPAKEQETTAYDRMLVGHVCIATLQRLAHITLRLGIPLAVSKDVSQVVTS